MTILHTKTGISRASGTETCPLEEIRVLLIEDFEDARQTIFDLLEAFGYQVTAVEDGAQARRVLRRPDVIISDIGLPDCSGYDLLQELRGRPGWEDVPAIAISGLNEARDGERAERAGFEHYLIKPVSIRELDHLVRALTRQPVS